MDNGEDLMDIETEEKDDDYNLSHYFFTISFIFLNIESFKQFFYPQLVF